MINLKSHTNTRKCEKTKINSVHLPTGNKSKNNMKHFIFVVLLACIANNIYAQWSEEELKPYQQKAEKTAKAFVEKRLASGKWDKEYDAHTIEFTMDTMRIEKVIDFQNEDGHYTTYDMHQMNRFRYEEYDKLLNKYYKILMNSLPAEKKTTVRDSQRVWLKYRDSEKLLYEALIGSQEGTMWPVVAGDMNVQLVKDRVLILFYILSNS